jgi:hypothetical protein
MRSKPARVTAPATDRTQVLVDHLDLAPPQLPKSRFHRVLQLLALQVVDT